MHAYYILGNWIFIQRLRKATVFYFQIYSVVRQVALNIDTSHSFDFTMIDYLPSLCHFTDDPWWLMFKVNRPSATSPAFLILGRAASWFFVPSLAQILFKVFLVHRLPYLLCHFLNLFASKLFELFIWSLARIVRLDCDWWFRLDLIFIILIIFKGFEAFLVAVQKNVWGALRVLGDIRDWSSGDYWWMIVYFLIIITWQDVGLFIRIGSVL